MRRYLALIVALIFGLCVFAGTASAMKRSKFGQDDRHEMAKDVDFEASDKTFDWKMVMPWSEGLLFYDVAQHFCDTVRLLTAGKVDITPYSAGEIVPAMQSFEAVQKGTAEVGHDWPGYWKGKNEAFVAFASVPFGLDKEGYNIWLYERGGAEMMDNLYGEYNMKALPGGNVGQELGFFSNKRATSPKDFKGLRLRTPGWWMDIMTNFGASVSPLPGGEVYLALERGVVDAAEFSSPAITYPMGFDQVTEYVIEPGVHQPSCQNALFFNKDAWNKLPKQYQEMMKIAAKETQLWSQAWQENLNAKAIHALQDKVEFVKMDKETLIEMRKETKNYLDNEVKKRSDFAKKVLNSQEKFIQEFDAWRKMRSGVNEPIPYEEYMEGNFWYYE